VSSWDPAAGRLEKPAIPVDSWSGPRPIFLHHERQRTTATKIPGEKFESVSNKKTPLLQPANDPIASIKLNANIGSRKHAVANCPHLSRLPVAAEGRLHSYFANSYKRRATAQPTVATGNSMI
jgi:hypothetical protein